MMDIGCDVLTSAAAKTWSDTTHNATPSTIDAKVGNERDADTMADFHADLGGDIYMTSTTWKSVPRIDLRKWSHDGGKMKPTRDGVSLTLDSYLLLQDAIPELSSTLDRIKAGDIVKVSVHLGANHYAEFTSPYWGVSIRQWYAPINTCVLEKDCF